MAWFKILKLKINAKAGYLEKLIGMVFFINTLLAVAALCKDMLFASYMGTSVYADALTLAFFIPEMLGSNLIGAASGMSCVPMFSRLYSRKGFGEIHKYIVKFNIYLFGISCVLVLSLFVLKNTIIGLLGPGLESNTRILCIKFFTIFLPAIPMFLVLSIAISASQVLGYFAVSSFAPVLSNIISLFGILLCIVGGFSKDKGSYLIVSFMLIGITSMVILLFGHILVKRKEEILINKKELELHQLLGFDNNVLEVVKVFLPFLMIIILSQSSVYVERSIASGFGEGSVSALNYAYRLSQFPIWVFTVAIGNVIFPAISSAVGKRNINEIRNILKSAIRLVLITSTPATFILFLFRKQIISLLFLRGAFDTNSLIMTSQILIGYSLSILGQSIVQIFLRFFLALGETFMPLIIFLVSAVINIAADYYFAQRIGLVGLGLGAFIASIISSIMFFYLLKLQIHKLFNI